MASKFLGASDTSHCVIKRDFKLNTIKHNNFTIKLCETKLFYSTVVVFSFLLGVVYCLCLYTTHRTGRLNSFNTSRLKVLVLLFSV